MHESSIELGPHCVSWSLNTASLVVTGRRDLTRISGRTDVNDCEPRCRLGFPGAVAELVTDSVLPHSSLLRCCTQRESRQV